MKSLKVAEPLFKFTTVLLAMIILAFSLSCKQKEEKPAPDVKEQTAGADVNNKADQKTGNAEEQSADVRQKTQPRDRNEQQSSQEKKEQEITKPDTGNGTSMKDEKNQAEDTDNAPAEPVLLARVNDTDIYSTDLEGKPLDITIDREILYQAGLKKGLDVKLKDKIEDFKKRLIIAELESEILADMPNIKQYTDKELEDYYNQNIKNYQFLKFKEISVDDRNVAEEIHNKALAGETFENIASDLSKSGVKVETKNIGFTRKYGRLFDSVEVGNVSDPLSEGNGFKVLRIVEVKTVPLNLVKRNLILAVNNKKKAEVLRSKMDQLKKENNIEVTIFSNGGEKLK